MSDALHMPPIKAPRRFWVGMFGACVAPIFWIGQVGLSYLVSAEACYGSDHPGAAMSAASLRALLIAFDAVAILAALAGGICAYAVFRASSGDASQVEGRVRFLAIWGLLSSLWFLAAVLFNTIVSLGVPPCTP
jgi:uncharacterized membrane protein YjgN (DUF898 family)